MTQKSELTCKSCGDYKFVVVRYRNYGDCGGFEYHYKFECITCGGTLSTNRYDHMDLDELEWDEVE